MLLPPSDVTRGLLRQLPDRGQAHFRGTALQVIAQLVEKRPYTPSHHAFVPPRGKGANRWLIQQFRNRWQPIEQIGRFDSHSASPEQKRRNATYCDGCP